MSVAADAIRKSVVVAAPVERAWQIFVEQTTSWWPLARHSIGGENVEAVVIEPERVYERLKDGTEHIWGRVLAWEPPHRLALTWDVDPSGQCGRELEIRFMPEGDGTRVELEHRNWPAATEEARGHYGSGWDYVLAQYEEAASSS